PELLLDGVQQACEFLPNAVCRSTWGLSTPSKLRKQSQMAKRDCRYESGYEKEKGINLMP
ncbi:MAG TPA: hypothetical protein VFH15_04120, partial [Pyrinomonadaceae bacterium]|nr:hypothetical protein [Pyrinomonadaceae bacterium]